MIYHVALQVLDTLHIVETRQREAGSVDPDDLHAIYSTLKTEQPAEYVTFDCASIALSQLLPPLRAAMAAWAPLAEPLAWLPALSAWKPLLATAAAAPTAAGEDPLATPDAYTELLLEAVYPPLQRAVMAAWEPTDPGAVLTFFDHWAPVLPPAVCQRMLRALVLPRLQRAAAAWEPRGGAPPPHVWLHPWLPFLATELRDLYPALRAKIAASLHVRRLSPCRSPNQPSAACNACAQPATAGLFRHVRELSLGFRSGSPGSRRRWRRCSRGTRSGPRGTGLPSRTASSRPRWRPPCMSC